MSSAVHFVYAPAAVRELDRIAIEEFGIPGYTLMTRAATATVAAARRRYPDASRWLVVCGSGNNAGDGYVIARLGREAGIDVTVAALSDPHRFAGDAAQAFRDFQRGGGDVVQFTAGLLDRADLVFDAMLGTGLTRPLEGAWLYAVESLNAAGLPVIAVDVPTGLDAGDGRVLGEAVRAAMTVTFVGRKIGCYVGAGPDCAGQMIFDALGVPPEVASRATPLLRLFDEPLLPALLPLRPATAHKGDHGHVLVVGGNLGMSGAARLAGEAALRSGAGLVSVATRPEHAAVLNAGCPELMCRGVAEASELGPLLARASLVALGPGLGSDRWARALWEHVVNGPLPLVVDADALNLLAANPRQRDNWILTPHPGEAARLLGVTTADVQRDRPGAVARLVARFGGTVVLKGAGTLVAGPGDLPWVIGRGNPGMATAGTGDVLTGVLAGLAAQFGRTDSTLAAMGCFVHAAAGDDAAVAGQRGLLARDLLPHVRAWLNPSI
jgi:NAD(P)H-hydrate epimerase